MTVFIVTPPDLGEQVAKSTNETLAQWGKTYCVSARYVYGDELCGPDSNELPPQFKHKLALAVDAFNPAKDYLVLLGDHLQVAALAAELGSVYPCFRVLRWDRKVRAYYPVLIQTRANSPVDFRAQDDAA